MTRLNSKLSITILGSLVATSAITGGLVIHNEQQILSQQIQQDGQSLARTIAAMSVEHMVADLDIPFIRTHIQVAVEANQRVQNIRVYDEDGQLAVEHPPPGLIKGNPDDFHFFRSPISVELEGLPPEKMGEVEVAFDNSWFSGLIQRSMLNMVLGTSLTFGVLALVLLYFLRKNVLRPVAILDEQVTRISEGDLSHPIVLKSNDELGHFANALDDMRVNLRDSYARIEEQVKELRELDRMKDEFLANTSHELKTPLNGIIGLTESFLIGSYGQLSGEQEEALNMVFSCAERLWKMTESILRFSRMQQAIPVEHAGVEQHELRIHLEDALIDLFATSDKKGVPLKIDIPEDMVVVYSRDAVEQVIRILVDNALKFTQEGHVQILAQRWQNGEQPGFQLAVRDTGIGIPGECKETVFEPFVQGFQHETRSHGGVGLGLSIAAKLAERMHAQIDLESTAGKGTTFTLLIPEGEPGAGKDLRSYMLPWPASENRSVHEASPRDLRQTLAAARSQANISSGFAASPSSETDKETHKEKVKETDTATVLVVDDDDINREVVWQALKGEYNVLQASDGPKCLEIVREAAVDLILLDIMMPGMSGYEVLEHLREEGLLERVTVIVLSAKTAPEAVIRGLDLGAMDYLSKPFHRDELLCRVRNLMELRAQRKRLENEVSAKSDALRVAEEASKVKSQFLSNMSHELRTPLNGILGFTELALDSCGDTDEEHRETIEMIRDCSRTMFELVTDILDMARIESHGLQLEYGELDVEDLLGSVVSTWREDAKGKGLELSVESLAMGRGLWTDTEKVRRILHHLVSNAVKFTEAGHVRVSASAASSNTQNGKPILEVQVADTGIGIEESRLDEIFTPFHQGDNSSTREHGGAGLGLALCRTLAHGLGGELKLTSRPGEGTVAFLTLPLHAKPPQYDGPRSDPGSGKEKNSALSDSRLETVRGL